MSAETKDLSVETASDSCRTIARLLLKERGSEDPDDEKCLAMLGDLCAKAEGIHDRSRAVALCQGFYAVLPAAIRSSLPITMKTIIGLDALPAVGRQHRDIGIVTVIPIEREAVLCALGLQRTLEADAESRRYRYWNTEIERPGRSPLSVVVTMVGEPRNVPCALAVEHMLNQYDVDLLVLVGICAGPRSKTRIGDVVVGHRILDYEHVRSERRPARGRRGLAKHRAATRPRGTRPPEEKPRPLSLEVPQYMMGNLSHMSADVVRRVFQERRRAWGDIAVPSGFEEEQAPRLNPGTIASGERLLADGRLEEMRVSHDDRIRGGTQDDSGFAQACNVNGKGWIVFRGVSDYGEFDKPSDDEWQPLGALSAACAAVAFLARTYHCPRDSSFED